jgi:uncharacterized protein YbaA (DUF1428 family)
MAYVDGFVIPVPNKNRAAYRKLARTAAKVWRAGALDYWECMADDVPAGKSTSFPRSLKLKPDEVVVFSWIVDKSRAHRDRVNRLAMADPRIVNTARKDIPFEGKRMIYGEFKRLA